MELRRIFRYCGTLAAAMLIVAACETTAVTEVERAARAKNLDNAPYSMILVVGAAHKADTVRAFEAVLVEELANYDTRARAMHKVRAGTELSESLIKEAAEEIGADAVLVTTVDRVDTEVNVGEQRVDLKERPQRGGLADFFRHEYEEVVSEPSVDVKFTASIVTDVYDVQTNQRIYTVESATARAKTPEEVIVAESAAIAERMHKDGIIR